MGRQGGNSYARQLYGGPEPRPGMTYEEIEKVARDKYDRKLWYNPNARRAVDPDEGARESAADPAAGNGQTSLPKRAMKAKRTKKTLTKCTRVECDVSWSFDAWPGENDAPPVSTGTAQKSTVPSLPEGAPSLHRCSA